MESIMMTLNQGKAAEAVNNQACILCFAWKVNENSPAYHQSVSSLYRLLIGFTLSESALRLINSSLTDSAKNLRIIQCIYLIFKKMETDFTL
jgi:hypothetical protein